jgi:hypothetical protein
MKYFIIPLILFLFPTVVSSQYWIDSLKTVEVYAPNAFTADNDNVNDAWRTFSDVEWDEFLVEVYNCWGDCIWYSTDPKEWWMGEGNMDEPNFYSINGTYYYVLKARAGQDYCNKMGCIYKIR